MWRGADDPDLRGKRRRLLDKYQFDDKWKETLAAQLGQRYSWYASFGVDGRAVLRNIFLDGNTYQTSHSVSKEYFVADFQMGLTFQWRDIDIGYTQFFRTPEFRRTSDPQVFGSVQVAFRF